MGMAASQARYLSLTARKNNVEYQGQQVNQARTALATESANLYNQLLALDVPTAPSAADYYTTRYTFADGSEDYQIVNPYVKRNQDGTYDMKIKYDTYVPTATSNVNIPVGSPVVFNANHDAPQSVTISGTTYNATATDNSDTANIALINKYKGDPVGLTYYKYTNASKGVTYYLTSDDIQKAKQKSEYWSGDTYTGGLSQYYVYDKTKSAYAIATGAYQTDEAGNLESVNITKCDDVKSLEGKSFDLDLEEIEDSEGYQKALTEYKRKKALYDKEIENINAKTATIQQQDKTLELQLRQLDTEQEALSKEMEAVKDVIKKNVESTFKTFA